MRGGMTSVVLVEELSRELADARETIARLEGDIDIIINKNGVRLAQETMRTERAEAEAKRMRDAVEFAHSEGFEWPVDPFKEQ